MLAYLQEFVLHTIYSVQQLGEEGSLLNFLSFFCLSRNNFHSIINKEAFGLVSLVSLIISDKLP